MKKLFDFFKPILIKTTKYFITIVLTALASSTLASCVMPCGIRTDTFIAKQVNQTADTLVVNDNRIFSIPHNNDSITHLYDDEALDIMNNATDFLKSISNKILK